MPATQHDFTIEQGAKFNPTLLFMQPTFTVEDITGITNSGRARVTSESHGLTIDWPVYIVGVVGMEKINHKSSQLEVIEYAYTARVDDSDHLLLDVDTTRYGTYESGGQLMYRTPTDLTGYTARMQIRETKDASATIVSLTSAGGGISLGGAAGTVTPIISAADTALLDFTTAYYDIELLPAGVAANAFRFLEGRVKLSKEVTR